MNALRVRKNFNFDKEMIDKVTHILKEKHYSFTEVLTHFFQAVIKEPELIETIQKKAEQRQGSFIGMLNGKIGNETYKSMKREHHEHLS